MHCILRLRHDRRGHSADLEFARYVPAAMAASRGSATSCMTAVFADTNIVVYAYAKDPQKSPVAEAILVAAPAISTQVVGEFLNIARTKMGLDLATRHRVAQYGLRPTRSG